MGGSRSGKSRYAVRRATERGGPVLFLATGVATDDEMAQRIARHRAERPPHWTTIEAPYDLAGAVRSANAAATCVLVDDLATLISNLLVERAADETQTQAEEDGLIALSRQDALDLFVVSAEVGLGLVPETLLGRRFRDLLGLANQHLAAVADEVILLVAR